MNYKEFIVANKNACNCILTAVNEKQNKICCEIFFIIENIISRDVCNRIYSYKMHDVDKLLKKLS